MYYIRRELEESAPAPIQKTCSKVSSGAGRSWNGAAVAVQNGHLRMKCAAAHSRCYKLMELDLTTPLNDVRYGPFVTKKFMMAQSKSTLEWLVLQLKPNKNLQFRLY